MSLEKFSPLAKNLPPKYAIYFGCRGYIEQENGSLFQHFFGASIGSLNLEYTDFEIVC